jgi:hypothetical protein
VAIDYNEISIRSGNQSSPWDNAAYYETWVYNHEYGHVLGLNHYGQYISWMFEPVYIDYINDTDSDLMRNNSYFHGIHAYAMPHDGLLLSVLYPGQQSCS